MIHFYLTNVDDCLEKNKKIKKIKKINVLRIKKMRDVYLSLNTRSMRLSGILFMRYTMPTFVACSVGILISKFSIIWKPYKAITLYCCRSVSSSVARHLLWIIILSFPAWQRVFLDTSWDRVQKVTMREDQTCQSQILLTTELGDSPKEWKSIGLWLKSKS